MITIVKHAGCDIKFREIVVRPANRLPMNCVICNKCLSPGQKIYSVISLGPNGPFPNVMIHKSCINPAPAPFDKNNSFAWGAAKLHELWKAAQQYKHWWV